MKANEIDAKPKLMDFNTALHSVLATIPGAMEAIHAMRVAKQQEWEESVADAIQETLKVSPAIAMVAVKHSRLTSTALQRADALASMISEVERMEEQQKQFELSLDSDDLDLILDDE